MPSLQCITAFVNQSINQSINQPINQSINLSINQSITISDQANRPSLQWLLQLASLSSYYQHMVLTLRRPGTDFCPASQTICRRKANTLEVISMILPTGFGLGSAVIIGKVPWKEYTQHLCRTTNHTGIVVTIQPAAGMPR
jgi:hypothetical protein